MRLLAKEQGLWAYIYEGISYDAGDKLGFLKATVELALQNKELGSEFPRLSQVPKAVTANIWLLSRSRELKS